MKSFAIFAAMFAVALALAAPASAEPSFQGMGFLPSYSSSYANAVSGNGQVVVGQSGNRSFRWTAGEGMQDLGVCEVGVSDWIFDNSSANGVSYDGSVVVGSASTSGYTVAPYRWTAGGGMVRLHDEMDYAYATDTSDSGFFTVGYQQFYGWRHPYANGDTVIPMFEGTFAPVAQGVSGDGGIVVGHGNWGPAFRWVGGSAVAAPLYAPEGWGGTTRAYDISRNGAVIVGSATHPDGPTAAVRWTAGTGGFELLGLNAEAYAASGDGSVVVGNSSSGGGMIWDAVHGMRNLQQVLSGELGLDLSGWSIYSATDISSNGNVIVGYGTHEGQYEGFVAVIPEPGSLALLGLAALAALRRRGKS